MTRAGHRYLLDNRRTEAGERFDALPTPSTRRRSDTSRAWVWGWAWAPGRCCPEAGAGGTSVVSRPTRKAGPTGKVLDTDTDTDTDVSRLAPAARPPVEVRVHDVGTEQPPGEGFDLVHARLVLTHVPQRNKPRAPWSRPCGRVGGSSWRTRTRPSSRCSARTGKVPSSGRRTACAAASASSWPTAVQTSRTATGSPPAARGRTARRRGRRLLPPHPARLRRAGIRRGPPASRRPRDRRLRDYRPRDRRGHRPPPRLRRLSRHGPRDGPDDLGLEEEGVAADGRCGHRRRQRPAGTRRATDSARRCPTSTASPRPTPRRMRRLHALTERRPTPPPRWTVPVCRPPAPPPARPPRTPRPRPSRAPRPRAGRRGRHR